MKRIYVNEEWCLGCRLCEYNCAFANSGGEDMARSLMGVKITPNIKIEKHGDVSFAVSCRHCKDPICVRSCLTGALSVTDGVITVDRQKCISCYTCITVCPYGAISPSDDGAIRKCELCIQNGKTPACVKGCPNGAIIFEDRG